MITRILIYKCLTISSKKQPFARLINLIKFDAVRNESIFLTFLALNISDGFNSKFWSF
jgi:hypothetical protein